MALDSSARGPGRRVRTGQGLYGARSHVVRGCSIRAELAGPMTRMDFEFLAVRGSAYRMRKRLRQCVKAEVAGTLDDPEMVQEELQTLFAALGG